MPHADRRTLVALCVIEDAIHTCQYIGPVPPPAWGLRLALACLYEVAGDDPGVAPKTRDPFDKLWRIVTGAERVFGGGQPERLRSTFAGTEYARIRRMVRIPQSLENDAVIAAMRSSSSKR